MNEIRLSGVLYKAGHLLKNGHVYSKECLRRVAEDYNAQMYPMFVFTYKGVEVNQSLAGFIELISMEIVSLKFEDDELQIEAKILNTPEGKMLRLLVKHLIESSLPSEPISVSSLGLAFAMAVQFEGVDCSEVNGVKLIDYCGVKRFSILPEKDKA